MSRSKQYNKKYAEDKTTNDLVEKIKKLEAENKRLNKEIAKLKGLPTVDKKTHTVIKDDPMCPDCGAKVKDMTMHFGILRVCGAVCGWRVTLKDK